mmetsp:Transcript_21634/g.60134  ORF Transcript_21634/g.60134 Transcript_21634/m.60134 type:complete len:178 (+) Transcript_21634:68-601(+)|eukprot:CAMPEP_0117682150 /NCGR_PEP_ID=MMETSP0804-20121206/19458_1 /TAXON_ID=1074897 /ORGANISM="Tetraselmis astigmatica, Strain CCMP880" /LENGTH=177 /DNA_ID=CAMNT_0005492147 /DNA_START=22 /DNA_END=555 /DNA_ORIENTATION=-
MSRRGKHVTTSAVQADVEKPTASQAIVRALKPRGSNIFEVEFPDGHTTLVLLPTRFQKKLWVKNGGFVVIDKADEAEVDGCKITGTIAAVLYDTHIKQLKREPGIWPAEFDNAAPASTRQAGAETQQSTEEGEPRDCADGVDGGASTDDDDGLPPLEPNTNRKVVYYTESEDDSDDE